MSDTILTQHHDGWMQITLNRPDRLNAFNDEMHAALNAALKQAENPAVRALLLTGAGRGFCAGQDLEGRDPRSLGGPPDLGHTLSTLYNPLVQRLRNLAKPVVCAVNGVAAGAGANIVFGCDIVLAANTAKFVQSFAKVGLIPDAGGHLSFDPNLGAAARQSLGYDRHTHHSANRPRLGIGLAMFRS
jgi:2-(1,2-epoxy-1,2-dihydrophenyl)acetyl-CoA isomerase